MITWSFQPQWTLWWGPQCFSASTHTEKNKLSAITSSVGVQTWRKGKAIDSFQALGQVFGLKPGWSIKFSILDVEYNVLVLVIYVRKCSCYWMKYTCTWFISKLMQNIKNALLFNSSYQFVIIVSLYILNLNEETRL